MNVAENPRPWARDNNFKCTLTWKFVQTNLELGAQNRITFAKVKKRSLGVLIKAKYSERQNFVTAEWNIASADVNKCQKIALLYIALKIVKNSNIMEWKIYYNRIWLSTDSMQHLIYFLRKRTSCTYWMWQFAIDVNEIGICILTYW